jgi:hypothetical protein
MNADDARHGTNAGHRAHFSDNEKPCQPCRDAHAAYHRNRRARHYLARVDTLYVPPFRVQRRVRALQAIGWDLARIGRAMGYDCDTDQGVRVRVWNIVGRPNAVRLDVFQRVARAYDELSGTPGPSTRTRKVAEKNGWAPPLAWDNIDDPDATPYAPARQNRPGRPEVLPAILEDFDWLTSAGESPEKAAERVGVALATIRDYRLRAARREMERAS